MWASRHENKENEVASDVIRLEIMKEARNKSIEDILM